MPDMITSRYKLKDMFPDIAGNISKTLKEHDINPDNAEYIRKGLIPRDLRFEDGENAVIAYITTNTKDRDNEVVEPKGAVLEHYLAHPVVLFCHDYYSMPIGKCDGIKRDNKGLIAKTIYYSKGMGQEIFDYRKAGFPMAESIGFIPLEWTKYDENDGTPESKEGIRRRYTKWQMLEYSDVSVPSNPEALTLAVSKGIVPVKIAEVDGSGKFTLLLESENKYIHFNSNVDKNQITQVLMDFGGLLRQEKLDDFDIDEFCEKNKVDIFEKSETSYSFPEIIDGSEKSEEKITIEKPGWDETDTSFRYRIKSPGLFRDDTIKTVPLKKDKPKVNSVMGKLKKNEGKDDDPMVLQSLMFPKEDDWTLDKAKEWLSDHEDLLKFSNEGIDVKDTSKSLKEDELIIEKVGRELSAKNIKSIKTAIAGMETATTALKAMLKEEEPDTSDSKDIIGEHNRITPRAIDLTEMRNLFDATKEIEPVTTRVINETELRGLFATSKKEIIDKRQIEINENEKRNKGIVQL